MDVRYVDVDSVRVEVERDPDRHPWWRARAVLPDPPPWMPAESEEAAVAGAVALVAFHDVRSQR
jgi:hypothetical protein